MADVNEVQVVVAHSERVTLRVGDVFVKVDSDQHNLDVEVEAMALAPVPTPEILWRKPPAFAIAAVRGTALGVLGERSPHPPEAWAAVGTAVRRLHDAPLPPWPRKKSLEEIETYLDTECEWLISSGALPADLVNRNREIAQTALRPRTPVFAHGDLQITHIFLEGTEVTGIIDWSEASQGDPTFDLAILTLGHEDRLPELLEGYGTDIDLEAIRAWWSLRSLTASRWLLEHGFDPNSPGCEFDVLRARMRD
ncbi:phosphotransferase family protein [Kribbella sp. NPDC020789]